MNNGSQSNGANGFYTHDPEKRSGEDLAQEYNALAEEKRKQFLAFLTKEQRLKMLTSMYGDKLVGDLGYRSTNDHPKTDFGVPHFGGVLDDYID